MTSNTRVQAFKKSLIIETAQMLFAQNPYEAVTVDEIAKTAGFGKSTVYLFFESKEEILDTVLKLGLEHLFKEFQKITEGESDLIKALKLLIPLQYKFWLQYNSLLFTYFQKRKIGSVKKEWSEGVRDLVLKRGMLLSGLMQKGIKEGVFMPSDPQYLTWFVNSMIKGVCMPSYLLKPEMRNQEKDIAMLQEVILRGILAGN